MSFYDTLIVPNEDKTEYNDVRHFDGDTKQITLLKVLTMFQNKKWNTSQDFESFARSSKGDAILKRAYTHARVDQLRKSNLKRDNMTKETTMTIESSDVPSTQQFIENMSQHSETDINRTHREIENEDMLKSLYKSADANKKQAMNLMVEAMYFKDNNEPVPDRIRTALSRLRTEIQKTDPKWKLDLRLL